MSLHKRLIKYLVLRILINITVWLNHILILRVISNNQDNRTCKCSIKSNNKMYLKYIIAKVNLVKYECFFITIDFLLLTLVNVTVWLNLILMLRVTINNQDDRTFKYFIKSNKKKFKYIIWKVNLIDYWVYFYYHWLSIFACSIILINV